MMGLKFFDYNYIHKTPALKKKNKKASIE